MCVEKLAWFRCVALEMKRGVTSQNAMRKLYETRKNTSFSRKTLMGMNGKSPYVYKQKEKFCSKAVQFTNKNTSNLVLVFFFLTSQRHMLNV